MDINKLSTICKCSLSNFIIFSILTLGVYPIMWLYRTQVNFSDEFGRSYWKTELPIIMAGISGVTQIISAFVNGYSYYIEINYVDCIGGVIYVLLWIYWSFRMKEAIQTYVFEHFCFEIYINPLLLIIFGPAYIIYIITYLRREYVIDQVYKNEYT